MGRDPQLEKAVQVAMEELKKTQLMAPKKPRYPVHKNNDVRACAVQT